MNVVVYVGLLFFHIVNRHKDLQALNIMAPFFDLFFYVVCFSLFTQILESSGKCGRAYQSQCMEVINFYLFLS